jgi:hypothetical protein
MMKTATKQPYFLAIMNGNGANRTKANPNYMLAEQTGIFIVKNGLLGEYLSEKRPNYYFISVVKIEMMVNLKFTF